MRLGDGKMQERVSVYLLHCSNHCLYGRRIHEIKTEQIVDTHGCENECAWERGRG